MPVDSVAALVRALRDSRILEPSQLDTLTRQLAPRATDPRALARELMERGWVTPYQVNQLFQGRGQELVLGPYVLLERLGEGGMGQVFKARHRLLDRVSALKVIRKDRLQSADAIRRFHREIEAASKLDHPNIVAAYDAGEVGNTHFFAMEFVEGSDLGKLVKESGPLPVLTACEYVRQAALGLQHAFERGMVHRDIKPSNLLVTKAAGAEPSGLGVVKILDLGLARLQGMDEPRTALAQIQTVLGTPDYIAPEQARNARNADTRSDLYSLGCTFYYLLTGQPPFPGDVPMEKLLKHWLEEPRPVEQLRPEVPAAVAAVVRKLMAKRPEDRYQVPAELASALVPFTARVAAPVPALAGVTAGRGVGGRAAATVRPPTAAETPTAIAEAPDTATEQRPRSRSDADRRRLILINVAGLLALVLVAALAAVLWWRQYKPAERRPDGRPPTAEEQAQAALRPLEDRLKGVQGDPKAQEELRRGLLAFRLAHPGQPQTLRAAVLLSRLPSPLDQLTTKPAGWQPKELVAVVGEPHGRQWGPVYAVAVSPDGKLIAGGGEDRHIHLWGAGQMAERHALPSHGGRVGALAFAPGGKLLASGGTDNTVRLWNPATGKELAALPGHGAEITGVAFSADGKTLATASADGVAKVWDVTPPKAPPGPRKERRTLTGPKARINALALSPDGKLLAAAEADGAVRLWDVTKGSAWAVLQAHKGPVQGVAWSPDGKAIASAGQDGAIKLWAVPASPAAAPVQQERLALKAQPGGVWAVAFSPKGKALASAGNDGHVKLWDPATGKEQAALSGHGGPVRALAFAGEDRLVSGGQDGTVRQWVLAGAKSHERNPRPRGVAHHLAFAPDGRLLAADGGNGKLRLWEAATRKERLAGTGHGGRITCVAFAPAGSQAVTGVTDGAVRLGDADTGKEVRALAKAHNGPVTAAACSPDGRTLASAGNDKLIRLWDLATGQDGPTLKGHAKPVRWLGWSLDGKTFASADEDGVRLWDPAKGQERAWWPAPKGVGAVLGLALSPDGRTAAVANADHMLRLYDTVTGEVRAVCAGHTAAITGLAFTPDGNALASAGHDGRLFSWDPKGNKVREWSLPGPVQGLAV